MARKLTAACIFSGCGSAAIGAREASFKVSYLIDPRPFIVEKTWHENFPGTKFSRSLEDFRKTKVDCLIASPPCSRYSLLNRTLTRKQIYSIDPLSIEYTHFLNEVNIRQPSFFCAENLPRLRTFLLFSQNPNDNTFYVNFFDEDKNQMMTKPVLSLPGYNIYQYVLDSVDFGLPQRRLRLFVVGVKHGFVWAWKPPTLQKPEWLNTTLRSIPNNAPNHKKEWLPLSEVALWKKLKYGEKSPQKSRKMAPKEPMKTIVGASLQHYHYLEPRYLTARECAAVQGFPMDFIFYGSTRAQLNQIGKAISVPIITSLAKQIKISIETREQMLLLDGMLNDATTK